MRKFERSSAGQCHGIGTDFLAATAHTPDFRLPSQSSGSPCQPSGGGSPIGAAFALQVFLQNQSFTSVDLQRAAAARQSSTPPEFLSVLHCQHLHFHFLVGIVRVERSTALMGSHS